MKQIITTGITFDASAQEVTFNITGIDEVPITFDIRRLLAIINGDTIIYATATPTKGYTALLSNVLTLEYDTTAMNDNDPIQVIYDIPVNPATEDRQIVSNELMTELVDALNANDANSRMLLQLLKPLGIITTANGRIEVNIAAGTITTVGTVTTVTTVGTVTTVTNLTNIGGLSGFELQYNTARNAFANAVRPY